MTFVHVHTPGGVPDTIIAEMVQRVSLPLPQDVLPGGCRVWLFGGRDVFLLETPEEFEGACRKAREVMP